MPSSEERRSSERIAAQKEKAEREEKEQFEREEQARLELEDKERKARIAQGLPEDESLIFKKFTYQDRVFDIERKEVWRTKDDVRIGSWATKAYWKTTNFYPGQILRVLYHYPQTDLDAKYSPNLGETAMTGVEPLGVKMRWAVVLWSTAFGLFVLPMFTLKGKNGLKDFHQDRQEEYIAMITEGSSHPPEKLTPWGGPPIIMNINTDLDITYSNLCYVDLSRPMHIHAFEYLEENMGSIDGDEYLRLVSLFKMQIDFWMRQAFLQFKGNPTYEEEKLVWPQTNRESYGSFEPWRQNMADTEFKGQFLSKQAKKRQYEEAKPKSKTTSGSGGKSSGVTKSHHGGISSRGGSGRGGRGGGRGGRGGGGSGSTSVGVSH